MIPDTSKTIVALATPPGKGALAVIRITGKGAFNAFAGISSGKFIKPEHRQVSFVRLHSGKRHIDDVVALFFRSPHSYTGENTVEIMCHGSPYIIRQIINAIVQNGAFPASPGEFTMRAFLNGKMDLAKAEAVNALIASDSEASHHAAIAQTEGAMSKLSAELKDGILSMLADIEARLDDSDGDISDFDNSAMLAETSVLRQRIEAAAAEYKEGRHIRDGIKTVLVGAPNSGKSSLLNVLAGYDRAIVSPVSGTTRDVIETSSEINGIKVILTDTAGLSESPSDAIESEGMSRTLTALRQADMVLLLKDSSMPETVADIEAEKQARQNIPPGAELIIVRSKCDISGKKDFKDGSIAVSSASGYGLDLLKDRITSGAVSALSGDAAPAVIFARHFQALSSVANEMLQLEELLKTDNPAMEFAAEHLRSALSFIGQITGETVPDDVLEKIFSTFCVGK